MIVMPSNNTCWLVHYWAGKYGHLGHLYGPSRVERPAPHLPYALDNGAYGAFTNGIPWDASRFIAHVERYAFSQLRPNWLVVPDVVADAKLTLEQWDKWAPRLKEIYHIPLAVAVQDGMTSNDVARLRPLPDLVFVGGTTAWKWETYSLWSSDFERVHVGRVNTFVNLMKCYEAGVESCDGTGWFRGKAAQIAELGRFLATQAGCYSLAEEIEIQRIVRGSRTINDAQRVLPMGVAS